MALPNISLSDTSCVTFSPYLCGLTISDQTSTSRKKSYVTYQKLSIDEILENAIKYYFMCYIGDKNVHISCNHLRKCSIEFEISIGTQYIHTTDTSKSFISLSGNGADYLMKILDMHKKWHDECGSSFYCKDSNCLKSNQYTCTLCGKDIHSNFCDNHIMWHQKCPKMYHCYYINDNYDQYVCDICFRSIQFGQSDKHSKYHKECPIGYKCIFVINDPVPEGYECMRCNSLILMSKLRQHDKSHANIVLYST